MRQKRMKMAICAAAAVITFSNINILAEAATASTTVLPSAGINLTLSSKATSMEGLKENLETKKTEDSVSGNLSGSETEQKNTDSKTEAVTGKETGEKEDGTGSVIKGAGIFEETLKGVQASQDEEQPEVQAEEPTEAEREEESFKSLVIARVNNYVNVRSTPSEEGEVVGKLYDKSVGSFISEEDGWYEINSGSVTGYVKAEFCVTGEEAVELAKQVGTRIATVTTTTLKVREQPGMDATVLGLIPIEDELLVTEDVDGWVKVNIEEGDGYVSKEFVSLSTEFVQAESKEEEETRLAKEEAERKAAQAAARRAQQHAQSEAQAVRGEDAAQGESVSQEKAPAASSGGSGMGRKVADYGLQFVGNPYVYGGTSLTNGADCSGFVMSVYANFGVSLPHSSAADRNVGYSVGGLENAQPGDLVCYSGHVGIYIGGNQIVHASTAKTGIKVSNADYRTVLSVRRIF